MKLNDMQAAARLEQARSAIASAAAWARGWGKTAGLGHKGQKRPRGRLPQGRLRGRPDAAASPPAQARLQVADAQRHVAEVRLSDLEAMKAVVRSTSLALLAAG